MRNKVKFIILGVIALAPLAALAHGEVRLDEQVASLIVTAVWVTAIWVALLVLIAITRRELTDNLKIELFWGISAPVILVSLFVAGSTVYLNVVSETKGPVHWHADFKIYNCGQEVGLEAGLIDPEGLSNRIGTPVFHEHNDQRIHVEGTVFELSHLSLGSFFETIGGRASHGQLLVPTNEGFVQMTNGDRCRGGIPKYEGKSARLQAYLYRTEGKEVFQEKLVDWPNYVLSPHTTVPPGDCIIFDFSPEVGGQTDKICDFYLIELEKGDLSAVNFDYGN